MIEKAKIWPIILLLFLNASDISAKKNFAAPIEQKAKKNVFLLLKGISMFALYSANKAINKAIRYIAMYKKKIWVGTLSTILTLAGCTHNKETTQSKNIQTKPNITLSGMQKKQEKLKEEHTITILIHGTRFETPFIREKLVKNLLYKMYIQEGLLHSSAYKKNSNFRVIAQNLAKHKGQRFKPGQFYIFGWSGKLSHKERKMAAKKLHTSLLKLIDQYKKEHGTAPRIRLITHSHGGNVALNFAKINDSAKEKITISELILLACPAQKRTDHLLTSKTFEKIYSLYSGLDIIQVVDPQGLHQIKKTISKKIKKPFFSERMFTPQKNLIQVRVKINKRGIAHIEFLLSRFTTILPSLLEEIDNWVQSENNNQESYNKNRLLKISIKKNSIDFRRKLLRKPF